MAKSLNEIGLLFKNLALAARQYVDSKVGGKADRATTYSKTEVNGLLAVKQDTVNDLSAIRSGAQAGATAYQKPAGGIPSGDLSSDVRASLGKADSALQSYTETDPTVPSWAKQVTKPTYTASEVGALPADTPLFSGSYNDLSDKPTIPTVPTNVSAFTNDAGYLIQHQDISGKVDKQQYVAIDNSQSAGATLAVGTDYTLNTAVDTFAFTLPANPSDGEITVLFETSTQPAVSFSTSANVFVQDGFETQVNSVYELNIRAFRGAYYVVLVKMIPYAQA